MVTGSICIYSLFIQEGNTACPEKCAAVIQTQNVFWSRVLMAGAVPGSHQYLVDFSEFNITLNAYPLRGRDPTCRELKFKSSLSFLYCCRIAGVARNLWRSSSPTSPLKTRSARPHCSRPCTIRFLIAPRTETPQCRWNT